MEMKREALLAFIAILGVMAAGCLGVGGDETGTDQAEPGAGDASEDRSERSALEPLEMTGVGCHELVTWTSVPAEDAEAIVPDGYEILVDETGRAEAWAALKVCPEGTLDGEEIGERATGNVGVLVESPDGSDGLHFYQPWWITNQEELHDRLNAQGWEVFLEPDLALETDFVAPSSGTVHAQIPWSAGGYEIEAEVAQGPNPQAYEIITWHEGENGTLQMVELIELHEHSYGPSTITTEQSAPAAELFGPEQEGAGLYFIMDADFTVGPPEGG